MEPEKEKESEQLGDLSDHFIQQKDCNNVLGAAFVFVAMIHAIASLGGVDNVPWSTLSAGTDEIVSQSDYDFGLLQFTGCLEFESVHHADIYEVDCGAKEYSECDLDARICNPLDDCEAAGVGSLVLMVFGIVFSAVTLYFQFVVNKWAAFFFCNIAGNLYFSATMLWWASCQAEVEDYWSIDATASTGWALAFIAFLLHLFAAIIISEWYPADILAHPDLQIMGAADTDHSRDSSMRLSQDGSQIQRSRSLSSRNLNKDQGLA